MVNKMLDSGFCECGGQYEHIDEDRRTDGQVTDSYHCETCGTTCYLTWSAETEEEMERYYTIDCPECGTEIAPADPCWHCEHLEQMREAYK